MSTAGPLMMASGGLLSAYGQIKAGDDTAAAFENEANAAEENAAESLRVGAAEARKIRVISRKAVGEIAAAYGASGVRGGSAIDVIAESAANGETDAQNVHRQYYNQAKNLRTEASLKRGYARSSQENSRIGAAATLLGSGGAAYESWGK